MVPASLGLISLAVSAGLPFAPAAAKPPLQKAGPGVEVQPIAIAKVMKVNGQIVLAGDWAPYSGAGVRSGMIDVPFFDSFGREPGTSPGCDPAVCGCIPSCDSVPDTGGRWYFGSSYHNPHTIEDMQDCACPPGSVISEIDLGFFWCPPSAENCIVVYFPYEEVIDWCTSCGLCFDAGSLSDTGGGGVALNYGVLTPGCPFYYHTRAAGLESLGVLSPSTNDNGDAAGYADGSYQLIIASAVTTSAITLAAGPCQPMLWGTSRGFNGSQSTGPADCRPGLNNGDSYDDDAPTDGIFQNPGECYDYTFQLCPDPLGKMSAFCYLRCPADFNNDGFVDGIDADHFNNAFDSGDSCADLNGDCFVDGIDMDYFRNEFELQDCGTIGPCPTASGPPFTTQAYLVTGNSIGAAWSWMLHINGAGGFVAMVSAVPGVTAGSPPIAIASAFAASINSYSTAQGCGAAKLSAAAHNAGSEAYLLISVAGTQSFVLAVGDVGMPTDPCTPTCFFNPRMDEVPPSGTDCNGNGVDDAVDIAIKTSYDSNQNGTPDECEPFCPSDYNQDTYVDGIDYDLFFNDYESPDPQQQIRADFNGDGFVDGIDSDGFNNSYERGC